MDVTMAITDAEAEALRSDNTRLGDTPDVILIALIRTQILAPLMARQAEYALAGKLKQLDATDRAKVEAEADRLLAARRPVP